MRNVKILLSHSLHNASLATQLKHDLQLPLNFSRFHCELLQAQENVLEENWREKLHTALGEADVGLLMLSPQFFGADYMRLIEMIRHIGSGSGGVATPWIPVGLVAFDVNGILALMGCSQIHRWQADAQSKPKFYDECRGPERNAFAKELAKKIVSILEKLPLNPRPLIMEEPAVATETQSVTTETQSAGAAPVFRP